MIHQILLLSLLFTPKYLCTNLKNLQLITYFAIITSNKKGDKNMLEIKETIVKSQPMFKKDLYWQDESTLNKIFRHPDKLDRTDFYLYISSLKNIPGLILPTHLLKDKDIYGYQLPFIPDAKNIDELLISDLKNNDVLQIIKSMFQAIEEIHQYFIFGDVKNSNILIKDDNAYFIDWDFGKRLDSTEDIFVYYYLFLNKYIIPHTKLEDNIKVFISALSLYYGQNLEKCLANNNILVLLEILNYIKANPYLIYYLEHLIDLVKNKEQDTKFKFSELIAYLDLPSSKEKERLVRIMPH